MKLFLASSFSKVAEKLRPLLPDAPQNLIVGFVANAADPYRDQPWIELDKNVLKNMGFRVLPLDLRRLNNKQLRESLENIDVLFVAGGNIFYLLDLMRKNGFDKLTKEFVKNGLVYVGSSAGSVVAGPTLEPFTVVEGENEYKELLKDYKALGLIDKIILPHYGTPEQKKEKDLIRAKFGGKGFKLLPMTDEEVLIVE